MQSLLAMRVFSALVALAALLCSTNASPFNSTSYDHLLDHQAREILKRATPAAPHFVVYSDAYDGGYGPPAVSAVKVCQRSIIYRRLF